MDHDSRSHARDQICDQAAGSLSRRTLLSTTERPKGRIRHKERCADLVQPERIREINKTTRRRGSEERDLVFWRAGLRTKWISGLARSAELHAPGSER